MLQVHRLACCSGSFSAVRLYSSSARWSAPARWSAMGSRTLKLSDGIARLVHRAGSSWKEGIEEYAKQNDKVLSDSFLAAVMDGRFRKKEFADVVEIYEQTIRKGSWNLNQRSFSVLVVSLLKLGELQRAQEIMLGSEFKMLEFALPENLVLLTRANEKRRMKELLEERSATLELETDDRFPKSTLTALRIMRRLEFPVEQVSMYFDVISEKKFLKFLSPELIDLILVMSKGKDVSRDIRGKIASICRDFILKSDMPAIDPRNTHFLLTGMRDKPDGLKQVMATLTKLSSTNPRSIDSSCILASLECAADNDSWIETERILRIMATHDITASLPILQSSLNSAIIAKAFHSGCQIYRIILKMYPNEVDLLTLNLGMTVLFHGEGLGSMLSQLSVLLKYGIVPNDATFSAIVGFAKSLPFYSVLLILEVLAQNNIVMPSEHHNNLARFFAQTSAPIELFLIWKIFGDAAPTPDPKTQTIIFSEFYRRNLHEKVLSTLFFFTKMKGFIPDIESFNYAMKSATVTKKVSAVVKFYNEILKLGLEPNFDTYNLAASAFNKKGKYAQIVEILDKIDYRSPDILIIAMDCMYKNRKFMSAMELFLSLPEKNVTIPLAVIDAGVRVCKELQNEIFTAEVLRIVQSILPEDEGVRKEYVEQLSVKKTNTLQDLEGKVISESNQDTKDNTVSESNQDAKDNSVSESNQDTKDNLVSESNQDTEDNIISESKQDTKENIVSESNQDAEDNLVSESNQDTKDNLVSERNQDTKANIVSESNQDAKDNIVFESNQDIEDKSVS